MTDKLKQCPFCGGEARFNKRTSSYDGMMMYGVECVNTACCSINPIYTKEQALAKWNTRKPLDRIMERLEAIDVYTIGFETDEMNKIKDMAIEIVKGTSND